MLIIQIQKHHLFSQGSSTTSASVSEVIIRNNITKFYKFSYETSKFFYKTTDAYKKPYGEILYYIVEKCSIFFARFFMTFMCNFVYTEIFSYSYSWEVLRDFFTIPYDLHVQNVHSQYIGSRYLSYSYLKKYVQKFVNQILITLNPDNIL